MTAWWASRCVAHVADTTRQSDDKARTELSDAERAAALDAAREAIGRAVRLYNRDRGFEVAARHLGKTARAVKGLYYDEPIAVDGDFAARAHAADRAIRLEYRARHIEELAQLENDDVGMVLAALGATLGAGR